MPTWRPTCFIVQTTGFNRDLFSRDPTFITSRSSSTVFAVNLIRFQLAGEISHFIKALRLRQLRVKLISRVVKESSDSLFLGERRLISL